MVTRKVHSTTESQAPQFVRLPPGGATPARPPSPSKPAQATVRLTGRGGIVAIVVVTLVAGLLAHLTGIPTITGVAFTAVCVLVALLVRPTELLSLAVSPPLAYLCGMVLTEFVLRIGSDALVRGVAVGVGSQLAEAAPWLFLGTSLLLATTCVRGLPRNIRTLNDELNGRTPRPRNR